MKGWTEKTKILITGGTGSLGSALARKWYGQGYRLTLVSRCPHRQAQLAMELPGARFVLSDINDLEKMRMACLDQDILVHAAALKIIQSGERFPWEFVKVNVHGTETILTAWGNTHAFFPQSPKFQNALFISSDKACQAINLYGASKRVGEAIWRNSGGSVLRYGNVVVSRGSFLHVWKKAMEARRPVEVRTPEPTRFFLRMGDAIALVESALFQMKKGHQVGGATFIPRDLMAFSVWEVADAMGVETFTKPLTPGEKQHETLLAEGEYAVPTSDPLLAVAHLGYRDGLPARDFRSDTAPRMSGREFLRAAK